MQLGASTPNQSEKSKMATSIKQIPEVEVNPASPEQNGATGAERNPSTTSEVKAPRVSRRKWLWVVVGVVAVMAVGIYGVPWVREMMNTVSTDDAYVNGDVTYVAPRVSGQVSRVVVSENNVVRKGDLLIELDSEPYQVQVN